MQPARAGRATGASSSRPRGPAPPRRAARSRRAGARRTRCRPSTRAVSPIQWSWKWRELTRREGQRVVEQLAPEQRRRPGDRVGHQQRGQVRVVVADGCSSRCRRPASPSVGRRCGRRCRRAARRRSRASSVSSLSGCQRSSWSAMATKSASAGRARARARSCGRSASRSGERETTKRGSPPTASRMPAKRSGLEQSSLITQTQLRWVCARIESSWRSNSSGGGSKVAMQTATSGPAERPAPPAPSLVRGRARAGSRQLGHRARRRPSSRTPRAAARSRLAVRASQPARCPRSRCGSCARRRPRRRDRAPGWSAAQNVAARHPVGDQRLGLAVDRRARASGFAARGLKHQPQTKRAVPPPTASARGAGSRDRLRALRPRSPPLASVPQPLCHQRVELTYPAQRLSRALRVVGRRPAHDRGGVEQRPRLEVVGRLRSPPVPRSPSPPRRARRGRAAGPR